MAHNLLAKLGVSVDERSGWRGRKRLMVRLRRAGAD
jgi:hypothetical protein